MFNSASAIRAVGSMASSKGGFEGGICVTIIIIKLNKKLLISNVSAARYILKTQRNTFHVQY